MRKCARADQAGILLVSDVEGLRKVCGDQIAIDRIVVFCSFFAGLDEHSRRNIDAVDNVDTPLT